MQMFIWNNIFFSLGFDVKDHYKDLGGDAAAFVAPRNDLQGVKVYNAVDLEGLFTLGTVVLDYRGYRVTAQSIIPGILEREQEQSVVYGSIDFGKTVVTHPKYLDLLQKAGNQLKILPHKVVNDKTEEVELCSSVECKGIIGNDGRHYILDLLRTFPPDVNFLKIGLILHAVGEYDISLRFLEKALALNLKYHGIKSLKVAVSYHLVARTQSCMGDFRSALTNEKETYQIYKTQLGDEHDKTRESGECLKHLTQQAVVLQKKMNDLYQGKTKAGLPPIQIQPPSMSSVLDMLNIINGILFVQISQQDIENFKKEYELRQKDGGAPKKPELEDESKPVEKSVTADSNMHAIELS